MTGRATARASSAFTVVLASSARHRSILVDETTVEMQALGEDGIWRTKGTTVLGNEMCWRAWGLATVRPLAKASGGRGIPEAR